MGVKEKTPLIAGQKFGLLTIVERAEDKQMSNKTSVTYFCRCDCGGTKVVVKEYLIKKTGSPTRSCGCLQAGRPTQEYTGSREYNSWANMVQRCTNPNNDFWKDYGGRGISFEPRWETCAAFIEDMGKCPEGLTLERLDTQANYSKENCIWDTQYNQAINRRKRSTNKSGRTGICWIESKNCWLVQLTVKGIKVVSQTFRNFEDAFKAREQAEIKHHGKVRPAEYEFRPDLGDKGVEK